MMNLMHIDSYRAVIQYDPEIEMDVAEDLSERILNTLSKRLGTSTNDLIEKLSSDSGKRALSVQIQHWLSLCSKSASMIKEVGIEVNGD